LRLAVASPGPRGWTLPGTVPISLTAKPGAGGTGGTSIRLPLDATALDAIQTAKATPRADLVRAPVTIAVDRTATVASLASLLGALGYFEVKAAVLTAPAAPPPGKPAGAKPP